MTDGNHRTLKHIANCDAAHQAIVNGRWAGAQVKVWREGLNVWTSADLTSIATHVVDFGGE